VDRLGDADAIAFSSGGSTRVKSAIAARAVLIRMPSSPAVRVLGVGLTAGAITATLGFWQYWQAVRDITTYAPELLQSTTLLDEAERWRDLAATMFVAAAICHALHEWVHRRPITLVSLGFAVLVPAFAWIVVIVVAFGPESRLYEETGWITHPPSSVVLKTLPLIAGGPALALGAFLRHHFAKRATRSV
jgi:hypothetical protein